MEQTQVTDQSEDDYLRKFGYRKYEGERVGRKNRILSIIQFEVRSTWSRSTFGKVLLVIVTVINFMMILFAGIFSGTFSGGSAAEKQEIVRNTLNGFVANYITFQGSGYLAASTDPSINDIGPNIGFFLIALFAIAGSGLFADDKDGKVVEIYLSRLQKSEYIIGKIGSLIVYVNLFLLGPLLITVTLLIQSNGESHLDYIGFYIRLIIFAILYSLVIGLPLLYLSSVLDKRNYVSLSFFLVYIIGSIFADIAISSDPNNKFLLLISPDYILILLAFVVLGDFELGFGRGFFGDRTPLLLDDGIGLEYYHVLAVVFSIIFIFGLLLTMRIRKLTTEEL